MNVGLLRRVSERSIALDLKGRVWGPAGCHTFLKVPNHKKSMAYILQHLMGNSPLHFKTTYDLKVNFSGGWQY